MSKGLGKQQRAILDVLEASGGPMLSMDLVVAVHAKLMGIKFLLSVPPSFYESTRKAAAALVKSGRVLCGRRLLFPRPSRGNSRMVYWLPDHKPPELIAGLLRFPRLP
jgi:hypothetical protein